MPTFAELHAGGASNRLDAGHTQRVAARTSLASTSRRALPFATGLEVAGLAGAQIGIETLAHIPNAVYGALIVAFLLLEPMGLGKLYGNVRNYLLVWPFGYTRK